jgi:hypothetical protein
LIDIISSSSIFVHDNNFIYLCRLPTSIFTIL